MNEWKSWTDNELWWELVGEIAVAGGSTGWDKLYERDDDREKLSIACLRNIAKRGGNDSLVRHINGLLKKHGVRFVSKESSRSPKAERIARNFLNTNMVRGSRFVLLSNLTSELTRHPGLRRSRLTYERAARKLLASENSALRVEGFNLKSASDYLIEIGFAREIVAIDSNIRSMIEKICDLEGFGRYQIPENRYEEWEDFLREIAARFKLKPFELDRRLYAAATGWQVYLRER